VDRENTNASSPASASRLLHILGRKPAPDVLALQVGAESLCEFLILGRVADEAGIEIDRRAHQGTGECDELVRHPATAQKGFRDFSVRSVEGVDPNRGRPKVASLALVSIARRSLAALRQAPLRSRPSKLRQPEAYCARKPFTCSSEVSTMVADILAHARALLHSMHRPLLRLPA
jgi:hypothetical protein